MYFFCMLHYAHSSWLYTYILSDDWDYKPKYWQFDIAMSRKVALKFEQVNDEIKIKSFMS